MLPQLPDWDALHPLVVHFPIALLMVGPLVAFAAIFLPKYRTGLLIGAFVVMLLGTISAFVSVETGEAAADLVDQTAEISPVLQLHMKLAEYTRDAFTVLTVILALMAFVPIFWKRPIHKAIAIAVYVIFFAGCAGGVLLLVNAAHRGGLLVHQFGVHAIIKSEKTPVG